MRRKTTEEFKEDLKKVHGNRFEVLSEYKNNRTKIKLHCNICDNVIEAMPTNLLRGKGCYLCANNQQIDTETFKNRIKNKFGNRYTILGEYINSQTKIKVRCNKCEFEYEVIPNNLIRGRRCPKCYTKGKTEREIYDYLKNIYGSKITRQAYFKDLVSKKGVYLRYDMKLELNNRRILLEYNGEQHYIPMRYSTGKEDFILLNKHFEMKRKYALSHGYEFLIIRYDENWKEKLKDYKLIG